MSAIRRDDQAHRAIFRSRLVIAERQPQGGCGRPILDADTMTLALFGEDVQVKSSRHSQRLIFAYDQHGRQWAAIFNRGPPGDGRLEGLFGRAIESERGQDGAIGFGLGKMPAAEDIPEILLDSVSL